MRDNPKGRKFLHSFARRRENENSFFWTYPTSVYWVWIFLTLLPLAVTVYSAIYLGDYSQENPDGSINPVDRIVAKLDCRKGSIVFSRPQKIYEGKVFNLDVIASYGQPRLSAPSESPETPIVGPTRVCSTLDARLFGSTYEFSLATAFGEQQKLPSHGYAEWNWSVRALSYPGLAPLYLHLATGDPSGPNSILVGEYVIIPAKAVHKNLPFDANSRLAGLTKNLGIDRKFLYVAALGPLGFVSKFAHSHIKKWFVRRRRKRLESREPAIVALSPRDRDEEEAYEIDLRMDLRAQSLAEQIANPLFRRPPQSRGDDQRP